MATGLEKQIIARALEIIAEERHWTRGALARTSRDQPCSWSDPKAVKFCAVGALNRAAMEAVKGWGCSRALAAEELVMAASGRLGDKLAEINDDQGHHIIVEMFSAALIHRPPEGAD